MKSTPQIQHIIVCSPCSQDFAKMSGRGVNRHCATCDKAVTDFSKASTEEILLFFADKASGSVCARFGESQLKSLNHSIFTHTMKRRTSIWAASIFLMLLSFTSCVTHNPIYSKEQRIDDVTLTVIGPIEEQESTTKAGIRVKGIIVDQVTNEPLISASVYIPNTTVGAITDFDGYFDITIPSDIDTSSTIEFSYTGYRGQSVEINEVANKEIKMAFEDVGIIGDVVVINYENGNWYENFKNNIKFLKPR